MRFEWLIHVVISLAEAAGMYAFFGSSLGKRTRSKTSIILVYSLYIVISFVSALVITNINAGGIKTVVCIIAVTFSLYGGKPLKKLIAAGMLLGYWLIAESLAAAVITWFSGHIYPELPSGNTYHFVGAGLSAFLGLLILSALSFRRKPRNSVVKLKYQAMLLALIAACCFLAYADMIFLVGSGLKMTVLQLFSKLAIAAVSMFLSFMFEWLQDNAEREMSRLVFERQLREMQNQFELIESRDKEIRTIKHDLNNQLAALDRLTKSGNSAEMIDFTGKLAGYVSDAMRDSATGIPVIDAIIAVKREKAESQRIEFTVKSSGVTKIVINPVHLNVVLGNALDNTLEACARLPESRRRYVELALKIEDEFLYIRVTNSAETVTRLPGGLPASSKRGGNQNGYGLESIRRIVEQYGGIFKYETEDDEFILTLRLRNAPPHGISEHRSNY
jgi:sensor histidine kinase YesM